MLVSFYGKLPHHAEFLKSDNLFNLVEIFSDWIIRGQNHIGNAILGQSHKKLRIYFFVINGGLLPIPTAGIFLVSCDNKSREFPFILFHENKKQFTDSIKKIYKDTMKQVDFNISLFDSGMDNDGLLNRYESFLSSVDITQTSVWQSIYDSKSLTFDHLNNTLYRKLIMGY